METEKETRKEDLETLEEQTRIKLLTRGNYTCSSKPKSNASSGSQYQNKIQMKNEITENAQKISDILKTIPQYNLYFQVILESQDIELGKISEDDIETCESEEQPKTMNTSKFVSLKVKYYEKTWKQQMMQVKKNKLLQIFLDGTNQLIQILKSIQNKNIVHFNLHEKNILCSDTLKMPVLSNFNLSFQLEDLKKEEVENLFPTYEDYSVWPIEVYLISKIANIKEGEPENWVTKVIEQEELEKWIETFTNSPIFKKIASEERRELFKIQLTQYFNPIVGKPYKLLYENLIESARTWDLYGLSIIILETFIDLKLNKQMDNEFVNKFIELIKSVVYVNPNARPSIEYIEQELNKLYTTAPK